MSQQSATWPSMQYQHSSVLPGELFFMTQCFLHKNHEVAGAAWRTGFLVAGLLVQEKGTTPSTWLSLGPLQGNKLALLVRMQQLKRKNEAVYWQPCQLLRPSNLRQSLTDPRSMTFRYAVVTDFSKWLVVSAEALPPLQQGISQRKSRQPVSIPWPPPGAWTQSSTSPTPLLKHLAQQGFYNISKSQLQKLLKAGSHAFMSHVFRNYYIAKNQIQSSNVRATETQSQLYAAFDCKTNVIHKASTIPATS